MIVVPVAIAAFLVAFTVSYLTRTAFISWRKTRTSMGSPMTTLANVHAGQPSREDARRAPRMGRPFLFVALILTVNLGAVSGQAGWFYDHATFSNWVTPARIALALVLALAVEGMGVYFSMESDEARQQDRPYFLLMAGGFLISGFAAWLNWTHFHALPEAGADLARVFAGLSIASPILWTVFSVARNRARLVQLGQVGRRGLKLSGTRKVFHPIKSLRVMSYAAWAGIADEDTAVRAWTFEQDRPDGDDPTPVSPAGAPTKTERWAEAQAIISAHAPVKLTLDEVGRMMSPPCSGRWLRECRKAVELADEGAKA